MKSEISIKIGGPAGAGVKSVGQILTKTFFRLGYQVFEYPEYPSLIRGGHNTESVHAGSNAIHSQIRPVDILLALDAKTLEIDLPEVRRGGIIIFDSKTSPLPDKSNQYVWIDLPMLDLARNLGSPLAANMVGVGAVLKSLEMSPAVTEKILAAEFGRKGKNVLDLNTKALMAGYDFFKDYPPRSILKGVSLKESPHSELVMNGNEAVGLGAIAAGLGLYAAYPMTPSTPILHFLAQHQAEFGFVVKQPEDEISAVNMVVGAMHMGVRAMCATSGGGFALMNETLALAGMTETPLVVVLGQRPGPATGLPTWTEQGELQSAIHAGHGEFLRFILAPGDALEAFRLTIEAFNLAERYQTPAIILIDKYLGESSMTAPNLSNYDFSIDRGEVISEVKLKKLKNYQRYVLTDTGISPRSLPGFYRGVFCANSDEHGYHGLVDESSQMRIWQNEKRLKKLKTAASALPGPELIGPKKAKFTVLTWGSNKLPGSQAMSMLPPGEINILHFSFIWPINTQAVKSSLAEISSKSILMENNATGQFQALLKEQVGFEPSAYFRKFDGRPFYPEEIIEKITKF